jgi:CheY-like chemotaxis protein
MNLIRSIIPSNIEIREKIFSKTKVLAESTQIHQVLMNLCTNAAQAMGPDGGTISISVSDVHLPTDSEDEFQLTLPEGDYVRLKVSDTGSGIPEDAIDSIFNPYFTTKTPEKGTGMGLAIVHSIIKGCNGEISVKTETEIGTVFSVFIPSTNEAEPPKAYKKDDFPGGTETILLVDDEMGIITSTGGILKALGYTVVGCNDSRDALKLIEEDISRFDILMTDMTMPHLTGDKLAEAAMKLKKNFPVIICTGYSERMTSEIAAEMGIKAFLLKPIDINDLTATLRNALEGAS